MSIEMRHFVSEYSTIWEREADPFPEGRLQSVWHLSFALPNPPFHECFLVIPLIPRKPCLNLLLDFLSSGSPGELRFTGADIIGLYAEMDKVAGYRSTYYWSNPICISHFIPLCIVFTVLRT
jgi:hypothetical protein